MALSQINSTMRSIRKATEAVIVALFAVLVSVVFLQVIARYVFNQPPAWSEELARYLQVWIILLASPLCIRKGSHLAVDYFSHKLSPAARFRLDILIGLLITFYVAVVTLFGVRLMVVGRFQISPAMGIPMAVVYAVLPLSGALMFLESVLRTWHLVKSRGEPA
jgi:TRAP-type C4-dicarboxylate transport system permease small subunit